MNTPVHVHAPPASRPWLPVVYALSAVAAILAASQILPAAWFWVLKPLTTTLLIAHVARTPAIETDLRRWVLAGLVLSLAGDTALLWREGFLAGLVCFLCAHLAYIVGYARRVPMFARWEPFVFYGLVAAGTLTHLWPGVPAGLRVPVVMYVLCLVAMAAQAAAWAWFARGTPTMGRAGLAAAGGALFLTSDTLLAVDRFTQPLALRDVWVLGTYWAAQWCIAASVGRRGEAAGGRTVGV
ncbi:MAG TPA: lysoplasmalogenase [Burkholderiaceae bacterium]|nr:lysoplasmalogenase [Burkholderiaceae bacterium]